MKKLMSLSVSIALLSTQAAMADGVCRLKHLGLGAAVGIPAITGASILEERSNEQVLAFIQPTAADKAVIFREAKNGNTNPERVKDIIQKDVQSRPRIEDGLSNPKQAQYLVTLKIPTEKLVQDIERELSQVKSEAAKAQKHVYELSSSISDLERKIASGKGSYTRVVPYMNGDMYIPGATKRMTFYVRDDVNQLKVELQAAKNEFNTANQLASKIEAKLAKISELAKTKPFSVLTQVVNDQNGFESYVKVNGQAREVQVLRVKKIPGYLGTKFDYVIKDSARRGLMGKSAAALLFGGIAFIGYETYEGIFADNSQACPEAPAVQLKTLKAAQGAK